jgi:hypothetical protein
MPSIFLIADPDSDPDPNADSDPDPNADPDPVLEPGFQPSFLASWIRIRIQQLKLMQIHADPDPDADPQP